MMRPSTMALLLPLLAAMFIVVWAGGVGTIFILLAKTSLENWGAVILGMALVVGIPFFAALIAMPRR